MYRAKRSLVAPLIRSCERGAGRTRQRLRACPAAGSEGTSATRVLRPCFKLPPGWVLASAGP